MPVKKASGARGRADMLVSRIVRSRGACQRCGRVTNDLQAAHIVSRRYSATRCVEDNIWCLCSKDHRLTGEWAHHFMALVARTIGVDRYKELYAQALEGPPGSSRVFWAGEVERLLARCAELGIDTRHAATYPWRAEGAA